MTEGDADELDVDDDRRIENEEARLVVSDTSVLVSDEKELERRLHKFVLSFVVVGFVADVVNTFGAS